MREIVSARTKKTTSNSVNLNWVARSMQTSLLTIKWRCRYLMLVFFRCCALFIYRRSAHKKKRCNSIRNLSSRMSSFENDVENVKLIVSRQMKLFPSILANPTTPHQMEFESYAVAFVSFFVLFSTFVKFSLSFYSFVTVFSVVHLILCIQQVLRTGCFHRSWQASCWTHDMLSIHFPFFCTCLFVHFLNNSIFRISLAFLTIYRLSIDCDGSFLRLN